MRIPLLMLFLCPLYVSAQYRPMYTPAPSRPMYTPAPVRPGPSPMQMQQQTQQIGQRSFQRQQTEQTQMAMQNQMRNQQQLQLQQNFQRQQMQQQLLMRRPLTPEQLDKQQAHQQEAEQQATDYLAHFAQEQRDQRLAHPAADAQQAAAQQQADARELTTATVKAYREVFLPGQVQAVMQARLLSPKGQNDLLAIRKQVLDKAWWSQPDAAQLNSQLAAHSRSLTALTTALLGFDLASPPPAPAPVSVAALDAQLATDAFDPATATQLMRDAAQAEKRLEGERLAQAVQAFSALTALAPAQPLPLPQDSKQRQKDVKQSLNDVDKELQRYYASAGNTRRLYETQKAILASTASYLAKNKK